MLKNALSQCDGMDTVVICNVSNGSDCFFPQGLNNTDIFPFLWLLHGQFKHSLVPVIHS